MSSPGDRFDGDGMVHAVRIKDGAAAYSNRLVKTHRLANEKRRGYAMYQRVRALPICTHQRRSPCCNRLIATSLLLDCIILMYCKRDLASLENEAAQ